MNNELEDWVEFSKRFGTNCWNVKMTLEAVGYKTEALCGLREDMQYVIGLIDKRIKEINNA